MLVEKLNSSDPMLVKARTHFDGTMVYAQNKRQQVVLCELWAHSHPEIVFASMHPGWADTPVSLIPMFYGIMVLEVIVGCYEFPSCNSFLSDHLESFHLV